MTALKTLQYIAYLGYRAKLRADLNRGAVAWAATWVIVLAVLVVFSLWIVQAAKQP
jgi:hypothetical protein